MQRLIPLALLGLCCSPGAAFAQAAENPTLASDWQFSIGTVFTDTEPKIGLSGDESSLQLIDLEALGVDARDNDFYFGASWQGLQRWRFDFTAYRIDLDGGLFSDQDYQFGELLIPEGSGVAVDFKSSFYILNANYAIWQQPEWEAGVGLGVYALDWEGGIALVKGDTGEELGREAEDFLAPLPTLGLFARYAFNEHLAFRAGADWLSVNIDEYDGEVLAFRAGLDWWFTQRWGLSAGFNVVEVDVEVEDEPFNAYLDASWNAAYLRVNLAF